MVTPVTFLKDNTEEFSAYGYFKKEKTKNSENILEVDWVMWKRIFAKKRNFKNRG